MQIHTYSMHPRGRFVTFFPSSPTSTSLDGGLRERDLIFFWGGAFRWIVLGFVFFEIFDLQKGKGITGVKP